MSFVNVTTNPSGQKEAIINGKKYAVQNNRFGEEVVIIDGKQVKLNAPLFENPYELQIDKVTEQLNNAKEKASMWCKIFDLNLEGVRSNRRERISFVCEYGNDINQMNEEQQSEYKQLLSEKSDYTTAKNRALAEQLSYTHQVVSLACSKHKLLNQSSIFGV